MLLESSSNVLFDQLMFITYLSFLSLPYFLNVGLTKTSCCSRLLVIVLLLNFLLHMSTVYETKLIFLLDSVTGSVYTGVDFCKKLCGVSIIRR